MANWAGLFEWLGYCETVSHVWTEYNYNEDLLMAWAMFIQSPCKLEK